MDLRVVLVLMVQTPPSSDTSMTGVETVAAFRSRKFTSRACSYQELQELIRCGSKYRTLHLDPDSEFWPHFDPDPDPGLCYQFCIENVKIIIEEDNFLFFL